MTTIDDNSNSILRGRDRRFIRRASYAFILAIVLVISLQLASFIVLRTQIEREAQSATLISAAGNQRVRSQRITMLSLALLNVQSAEIRDKARAALSEEINDMRTTHTFLVNDNPQLANSGEKSKEVSDIFFEKDHLDKNVQSFLELASDFAAEPNEKLTARNPTLLQLTELSTSLLSLFEKLTTQYRNEGNAGITGLETLATQILAVQFAASIAIIAFIFTPIIRRLKAEFAERNRTRMELIEQNQELEQFATIVAHDLKAPLNNIGGFSQYLRSKFTSQSDQQALEIVEHIHVGTQRMGKMIAELLNYARITRKERKHDKVSLTPLLKKIASDFEHEIQTTTADLHIDNLPEIVGDSVQIEHLFHNLLSNALKYRHPDRQPRITVTSERQVHAQSDSPSVTIIFTDNGKGFPPGTENRMFEPFKQLEQNGASEGIGFGLSLCKKIVRRHGGSISAESIPTGGAKFIVNLPA